MQVDITDDQGFLIYQLLRGGISRRDILKLLNIDSKQIQSLPMKTLFTHYDNQYWRGRVVDLPEPQRTRRRVFCNNCGYQASSLPCMCRPFADLRAQDERLL